MVDQQRYVSRARRRFHRIARERGRRDRVRLARDRHQTHRALRGLRVVEQNERVDGRRNRGEHDAERAVVDRNRHGRLVQVEEKRDLRASVRFCQRSVELATLAVQIAVEAAIHPHRLALLVVFVRLERTRREAEARHLVVHAVVFQSPFDLDYAALQCRRAERRVEFRSVGIAIDHKVAFRVYRDACGRNGRIEPNQIGVELVVAMLPMQNVALRDQRRGELRDEELVLADRLEHVFGDSVFGSGFRREQRRSDGDRQRNQVVQLRFGGSKKRRKVRRNDLKDPSVARFFSTANRGNVELRGGGAVGEAALLVELVLFGLQLLLGSALHARGDIE